jgi:hypothetical protein
LVTCRRPEPIPIDPEPLTTSLKQVRPLRFSQVRRSREEKLFNSLMDTCHYLGYCQPVGEHLKYMVLADNKMFDPITGSVGMKSLLCKVEKI